MYHDNQQGVPCKQGGKLVFILPSSSIFKFHTYMHTPILLRKNRSARKDGPTNFALRRGSPKTGRDKNLTSICFFVNLGFIYNRCIWRWAKMQHPGFEPCIGGTSIGCSTIELHTYLLIHLYCHTSAASFMLVILYGRHHLKSGSC